MKKARALFLLIVSIFFFYGNFVCGQGINNIFMYGYFNGGRGYMKVDSSGPTVYHDTLRTINMNHTNTNIADNNGNLLFYTNGVLVCDALNDTMPNGKGLNPCLFTSNHTHYGLTSPQADLILPDPGNSLEYYLIHQSLDQYPMDFTNTKVYFSKINMLLNNGKGDLSQKNIIFYQDTMWGGGTTACKHANGRDWWIVVVGAHLPKYYVFLLTPLGISYQSTQIIGNRWDFGQTAFSSDGNYYGIREFVKNFQIFDFDRCTGIFSNARYVGIADSLFGAGFCFSPNSKLAYATSAHYIYQVNLDSINLDSSMIVVATWDSTYNPFPPIETGFWFPEVAADGKLYIATTGSTEFMHYINFPDSSGVACDVHQHDIALTPAFNDGSVPNHPNYFLGPVAGSICDSLGLGVPEHALHDFKFSIQPNPIINATLSCKYVLPQNKAGTLEIMDMAGRSLLKEPLPHWSTEQHIKLHLSPGIYAVRITSNRQQAVLKMIVQ